MRRLFILALLLALAGCGAEVTGTAAVAVLVTFCALRAGTRQRSVTQRALFLTAAIILVALFLVIPPGDSSFGRPGFSYTAAASMLALAPLMAALIVSIWLSEERHSFIGGAVTLLAAMSFFTFIFSTRDIIIENAGRFIYHAGLIGFPLLLAPLVRVYYFLRRHLFYTTAALPQQAAAWFGAAALLAVILLPALSSVASSHDHLMRQDRQVVSADYQAALVWLRDNAAADAVIAASPYAPWAVPQFTGRALVRADYWLSPRDDLFWATMDAWEGDREAQQRVLQEADFLLLTHDEQERWSDREYEPVFSNSYVNISAL